jgi:hypothetical protein
LTHPAPLVLVYDWQGGEFAHKLGAKSAVDRQGLEELITRGERVVCYEAELGESSPSEEGFEWFCGMAFELSGVTPGRKLIVIDECQELIDPWNIPPGLGKILSRGRRREMDTCLIGRSANALQTTARDQVNELYCFRMVDGNSLKYPTSLGIDEEKLKTLKDTHFIYRDGRTGKQMDLDLWGRRVKSEKPPTPQGD